jgi:hypothetical protein
MQVVMRINQPSKEDPERTKVSMHTMMNQMPPVVENNHDDCSDCSRGFDPAEVDSVVDSLWQQEEAPSNGIPLQPALAQRETKAVNCLRLVTFLILVGAAILVSVAVYLIVKHDEEDTFEEQFNDLAFRLGTYQTLILLLCKWLS